MSVCHLPPGAGKWNKIENRMFCHIMRNWRRRPLESLEAVVNRIAWHDKHEGLASAFGTRHWRVSDGSQSRRCHDATMAALNYSRRIPWRLELRDSSD